MFSNLNCGYTPNTELISSCLEGCLSNFLMPRSRPSQKSPIPLDRYERLFDDVTDDRRPTLTATVLHAFRPQNNR